MGFCEVYEARCGGPISEDLKSMDIRHFDDSREKLVEFAGPIFEAS